MCKKKIAIALVALSAASVGVLAWQNAQVPELGAEQGRLKPLGLRPNDISSQTDIPEKYVEPLKFKSSAEATIQAIKEAAHNYGGEELKEETDNYLYFVFTTPHLHFHDDVEFLLDKKKKIVDVRSASRAGYSDAGLNRRRYEKIAEYYRQE